VIGLCVRLIATQARSLLQFFCTDWADIGLALPLQSIPTEGRPLSARPFGRPSRRPATEVKQTQRNPHATWLEDPEPFQCPASDIRSPALSRNSLAGKQDECSTAHWR